MSKPNVQQRYDDYIALWPGDARAKVCFSIDGDGVIVTDVTRGNQPKGSAGEMIAAAILAHGQLTRPAHIRAMNVLNKDEQFGRSSTELLTDVLRRTATALGGFATGNQAGVERGKPFVEVDIRY